MQNFNHEESFDEVILSKNDNEYKLHYGDYHNEFLLSWVGYTSNNTSSENYYKVF